MTRPAIHPGEILADELLELGITATQLSRELHVPANRITPILHGQRAMTADTALRLDQWLGTGPEMWLNLQKQYELRLAEQQIGHEIRQTIVPWGNTPRNSATIGNTAKRHVDDRRSFRP